MNRKILLFGVSILSIGFLASAAEWELVWSDEFNDAGPPDTAKWGYEEGFVRNRERQFYTRNRNENARVENGMLVIEARKEKFEGADYTSASLITRGKAAWRFGRIEVKAKLPQGRGTWPAIWMLGTNYGEVRWPDCGEIDIMEYVGFKPDTIHANIHCEKYNHVKGTGKGSTIRVENPHEDFHLYVVEWYEDRMDFFIDGNKYFTYANEGTGEATWPFDQPFYLIINLAIGGTWGGQQGIDDTLFPHQYKIDYVRVYQQAGNSHSTKPPNDEM